MPLFTQHAPVVPAAEVARVRTDGRLDSESAASPFVSVIVPVWNDAAHLDGCLRALEGQTYPARLYEVVVVNNDSPESVEEVVARYTRARCVREPRPGSYAARNTGLASARGEVVAFTDADCIPASDWIEKGMARLARCGERSVVAGRIEVFPRDPQQPNAVEQYEALFALAQKEFVTKYRFGATANLFAWREIFALAGPFIAELRSGGDLEWARRIRDYGYKLEYDDGVRVRHPARASLSQLYSKMVRVAGGLHDLRRIKGQNYLEFDRGLLMEFLPPVRAIARTLREPSLRRRRDRVKVCAVILFVRYVQALERLRLSIPSSLHQRATAR